MGVNNSPVYSLGSSKMSAKGISGFSLSLRRIKNISQASAADKKSENL